MEISSKFEKKKFLPQPGFEPTTILSIWTLIFFFFDNFRETILMRSILAKMTIRTHDHPLHLNSNIFFFIIFMKPFSWGQYYYLAKMNIQTHDHPLNLNSMQIYDRKSSQLNSLFSQCANARFFWHSYFTWNQFPGFYEVQKVVFLRILNFANFGSLKLQKFLKQKFRASKNAKMAVFT